MTQDKKLTESTRGLLSEVHLNKRTKVALNTRSAWHEGTNIQYAMRHYPQHTKAYLLLEVKSLVQVVGAKTTMDNAEEMIECCEMMVDDFPSLKLEEIRYAFDLIKRGKLTQVYDRLKMREVSQALMTYESTHRADVMEQDYYSSKPRDTHKRTSEQDPQKYIALTEDDLIALGQILPKDGTGSTSSDSSDNVP